MRPASHLRFDSGYSHSDSGSVSAHDFMSACHHAVMRSRCCVRDVRVGVTLARQARRHVHDLIAFVRVMIAVSYPRTSCRRVAMLWRTHGNTSRVRCHVHDLIAFVRVMIATPCPRITSRRHVATPHAPITPCPRRSYCRHNARCYVCDLIAFVHVLIAVSYPCMTSRRRDATPRAPVPLCL